MKITLTGTPGTGKTTVSELLAEKGFEIVHVTDFLKEYDIGEMVGEEREVSVDEMVEAIQGEEFSDKTVIEGHLSHHISSDICIVLRCRPDELEERLSDRGYSEQKIQENVEAEILDVILSEAVENQETVVEVDTTELSAEETTEEVLKSIEKRENDYGKVDWTEFL